LPATELQHLQDSRYYSGAQLPRIHALLFADDLIICGQASKDEAANISLILQSFCAALGQIPNMDKYSIIFS
jgi:hypothetical protein